MNVNLTPDLEKLVQEKVASGLYNNQSEVVREALPLDQDLYGVRAMVVGCARTVAVNSEVQLAVAAEADDPPGWLLAAAVLLTLAAAVVVLRRAQ